MVLPDFELFKQGAEARLYRGIYLGRQAIIKERFPKKYRHQKLDETITKERIKAEARALVRSKAAGVGSPAVYLVDADRRAVIMEDVGGITAREFVETAPLTESETAAAALGRAVGLLHEHHIIHGDLTTSNFIVSSNAGPNCIDIKLIDFGLSQISEAAEDKAVDLYVLERAVDSTHACATDFMAATMKAYSESYSAAPAVIRRLDEVRLRGRKRTMVG